MNADQCSQYVGDNSIAANTPQQFLIKNLQAVFQCLRIAGPTFSIAKYHFRVQQIDFLGRTITTKRVASQKQKIAKFDEKAKFPHTPRKHFNDSNDTWDF